MKGRTYVIPIAFKNLFPKVPTVRVLSPEGAKIKSVTERLFRIEFTIKNVHEIFLFPVTLSINEKPQETITVELQFCPACKELLVNHHIVQMRTTKGGLFPVNCCPKCGCVFIPKAAIMALVKQQESKIIVPGTQGMNLVKKGS